MSLKILRNFYEAVNRESQANLKYRSALAKNRKDDHVTILKYTGSACRKESTEGQRSLEAWDCLENGSENSYKGSELN